MRKEVDIYITLDPAGSVTLYSPELHRQGEELAGIGACVLTAAENEAGSLYTAAWGDDVTVQGRDFNALYLAHLKTAELGLLPAPYLVVLVGLAVVRKGDAFPFPLMGTDVLN